MTVPDIVARIDQLVDAEQCPLCRQPADPRIIALYGGCYCVFEAAGELANQNMEAQRMPRCQSTRADRRCHLAVGHEGDHAAPLISWRRETEPPQPSFYEQYRAGLADEAVGQATARYEPAEPAAVEDWADAAGPTQPPTGTETPDGVPGPQNGAQRPPCSTCAQSVAGQPYVCEYAGPAGTPYRVWHDRPECLPTELAPDDYAPWWRRLLGRWFK